MKDQPTVVQSLCLSPGTATLRTILHIPNMDCPSEGKLICDRLANVENVASVTFDLRGRKLTVEHGRHEIAPILVALDEIGMTAEVIEPAAERSPSLVHYRIDNMDCPSEEKMIRAKLAGIEGVSELAFDLPGRTLRVTHSLPSAAPIEHALSEIGMRALQMDGGV